MKALLFELEEEHMRHAGSANGELFRSYDQFIAAGMGRNTVAGMVRVAEALGFLRVNRRTGVGRPDLRDAHAYRLTYLASGPARDIPPTDEWHRIKTDEDALRIIEKAKKRRSKRASNAANEKQDTSTRTDTSPVPEVILAQYLK